MIDVDAFDGGLRAVDAAQKEVVIEIDGWKPGGEELEIGRPVDATIAGSATGIVLPGVAATIDSAASEQWRPIAADRVLEVSSDEHVVQVDGAMTVYVRLRSGFSIESDTRHDCVTIGFPGRTDVTVGFRGHEEYPTDRLRVPPTPEGVAAAITEAGTFHRTTTPDRSYPSMRRHPPIVALDENAQPNEVEGRSDGAIVFRLPPSFDALFAASPLAYYLSATIEIDDLEAPALLSEAVEHRFRGLESFPQDVASILSRVFYLDCLVRNVGPYGFDLRELHLLEALPVDAESIYSMPLDRRLTEYLSTPFERIAADFPAWPLSVSMAPVVRNVTAIPHLLDRLSLIFPPDATPLDERTIVQRSLGDFYRSATSGEAAPGIRPGVLLEPTSGYGKLQGWIAEGTTLDAFKCSPEAFSNRLDYLGRDSPFSVAVVLNAEAMIEEYDDVVGAYRERSNAYAIDVDVRERLTTEELARTFSSEYDFVHYIGHCDPQGLRCRDGNFSTAALPESNVQSFFLNACGSYNQGLELVRRGSVAGAVTVGDVLDEQAKKVGTTFARLLGRGYSVYGSLRLSRGKAIMNRQYAVVGDGTFTPAQDTDTFPSFLLASATGRGEYRLQWEVQTPRYHGGVFQPVTDSTPRLAGNDEPNVVTEGEFRDFLLFADYPVIYESDFYWPEELLEVLF